tara:strand:+ start:424 stop:612 length:189 start_codon:yes stop_codon:yes gene_type:complete
MAIGQNTESGTNHKKLFNYSVLYLPRQEKNCTANSEWRYSCQICIGFGLCVLMLAKNPLNKG